MKGSAVQVRSEASPGGPPSGGPSSFSGHQGYGPFADDKAKTLVHDALEIGVSNAPVPTESAAAQMFRKVIDLGVDGKAPGLSPSSVVGDQFLRDQRFETNDARVDALIRWHVRMAGTTGFATGLGGLATLPVALPAGMVAAWAVQARMVAAIAHVRGYDTQDERVRTVVIAALVNDATVAEALRVVGKDLATRSSRAVIGRVSGTTLIEINKKVGFRLLTKAGSRGVVNLSKFVPVAGGVVGGAVDAASTRAVGALAKRAFVDEPEHDEALRAA